MQKIVGLFLAFLLCACTNESIGYKYLGKKYEISPLGEGYGYDSDPLIRHDAFDCTTFVETALARGDIEKLNRIRYFDAKPDFLSRNHFIESDWITHNADLVENVSSLYGQTKTRFVAIDKKSWLKNVHNIDSKFPIRHVNLEYLPYSSFDAINNTSDLIVLFIVGKPKKIDTIGTDLAVVHMGFLLPGGKILRHASSAHGCVMDTDFDEYIANRKQNKNNIGIVLLRIK